MVARITSLEALELPELNNDKTVVPIQRLREDVIHAVQQSRKEDAAVIRKDIDTDYDDDERDCSLELDPYDTHSSRFVNQNTWPQGGVLSLHSLVNLKRISLTGKVSDDAEFKYAHFVKGIHCIFHVEGEMIGCKIHILGWHRLDTPVLPRASDIGVHTHQSWDGPAASRASGYLL